MLTPPLFNPERVAIKSLHSHPRNYRQHPQDQLDHLIASIRKHGFYRNIVVARDNVILAGHGIVKAAEQMGFEEVPIVRVDVDANSPAALKILTGDNEVLHLGEVDDRALTELLKEIKDTDEQGLLGTGYDERMLANLLMVTRPATEIADFDAAAEWTDLEMPEFEMKDAAAEMIVRFRTLEARDAFVQLLHIKLTPSTKSTWFPVEQRVDKMAVKFE